MRRLISRSALLAGLISLACASHAGPFTAEFKYDSSISGSTITHALSVKNTDGAGHALNYFLISLDADVSVDGFMNYSNLAWINDQGWTSASDDPTLALGGVLGYFANWSNAQPSIADGATTTFSYQFDYTGALLQSQQLFSYQAYFDTCFDDQDPACTALIDSGAGFWYSGLAEGRLDYNEPAGPGPGPGGIPEPATLGLLGAGLLGLALGRRRARH